MYLVDSHCHLDQLDLTLHKNDLDLALANAKNFDVNYFLCVCITLDHFPTLVQIANQYSNVSTTIGLHPNEDVDRIVTADEIISATQQPKVVGIGETGLDYYRSTGDLTWQRDRFREHIRAAQKTGLPLVIHSRMAKEDTISIMKEEGKGDIKGVMHCFTEDWEMAKAALDLGFYISFSGIVTFKNATQIQEVAKKVPLERMLLETDSPYLAPVPHRGKPNEPAYVRFVAEFIAELRGIGVAEVAQSTTDNFFKLFSLATRV